MSIMSIRFHVSDDGHLSPQPSAFSPAHAVALKAPMMVWRRPMRYRLAWRVASATALATVAIQIATHLR